MYCRSLTLNESSTSEKLYKNPDEDPPKKSHKKKPSVLKGYSGSVQDMTPKPKELKHLKKNDNELKKAAAANISKPKSHHKKKAIEAPRSHHKKIIDDSDKLEQKSQPRLVKKHVALVKESPEKISTRGRKIFPKTKDFFFDHKKASQESSSQESKKEMMISAGKRKRIPLLGDDDSSEESMQVHKKQIVQNKRSFSNSEKNSKSKEILTEKVNKIPEEKKGNPQKKNEEDIVQKYKYKPFLPKNNIKLTAKGSFLHGDKARNILSAKLMNDEILCHVEWFPRKDGSIPENSSFSNTLIKEYDPLILTNFYETRMKMNFESSKSNFEI